MKTPRHLLVALTRCQPRRRLVRSGTAISLLRVAPSIASPSLAPAALESRPSPGASTPGKGGDSRTGKPREGSSSIVRLGIKANSDQETELGDEQRRGGIWELFSEAQRNIMYLHQQRLVAAEELKKLQDENKSLLQEIEVLEMGRQDIAVETAQSSSFCELLLRIHTLAISGMIGTLEASDLRKKVVINQSKIQSAFLTSITSQILNCSRNCSSFLVNQ